MAIVITLNTVEPSSTRRSSLLDPALYCIRWDGVSTTLIRPLQFTWKNSQTKRELCEGLTNMILDIRRKLLGDKKRKTTIPYIDPMKLTPADHARIIHEFGSIHMMCNRLTRSFGG